MLKTSCSEGGTRVGREESGFPDKCIHITLALGEKKGKRTSVLDVGANRWRWWHCVKSSGGGGS